MARFQAESSCISEPQNIPSELKRFRQLIAQNCQERLRLRKNLEKVARQLAKTHARARDVIQTAGPQRSETALPTLDDINEIYAILAAAFKSPEPRNVAAQKRLARLVSRCETCSQREMTAAEHWTQFEGIQFEYLLALGSQGADEPQIEKYAAIEELLVILRASLPPDVQH